MVDWIGFNSYLSTKWCQNYWTNHFDLLYCRFACLVVHSSCVFNKCHHILFADWFTRCFGDGHDCVAAKYSVENKQCIYALKRRWTYRSKCEKGKKKLMCIHWEKGGCFNLQCLCSPTQHSTPYEKASAGVMCFYNLQMKTYRKFYTVNVIEDLQIANWNGGEGDERRKWKRKKMSEWYTIGMLSHVFIARYRPLKKID